MSLATCHRSVAAALVIAWALLAPAVADAQAGAPWLGRLEVMIGAGWADGFDLGQTTAEIRRNDVPRGSAFPLFTASSEIRPTASVDLSVSYRLTPLLAVEGYFGRGHPTLRTRVSEDVELSAGATADDRFTRYVLGGSAVLHVERLTFLNGHGVPFVLGGVGYLRELYGSGLGLETGRFYHVGGGVKLMLLERRGGRLIRGIGVRTDLRIQFRDGGIELGQSGRRFATASVGLLVVL